MTLRWRGSRRWSDLRVSSRRMRMPERLPSLAVAAATAPGALLASGPRRSPRMTADLISCTVEPPDGDRPYPLESLRFSYPARPVRLLALDVLDRQSFLPGRPGRIGRQLAAQIIRLEQARRGRALRLSQPLQIESLGESNADAAILRPAHVAGQADTVGQVELDARAGLQRRAALDHRPFGRDVAQSHRNGPFRATQGAVTDQALPRRPGPQPLPRADRLAGQSELQRLRRRQRPSKEEALDLPAAELADESELLRRFDTFGGDSEAEPFAKRDDGAEHRLRPAAVGHRGTQQPGMDLDPVERR